MNNPNITYRIKTDQYDVNFEQYNAFDKRHGAFSENGEEYTVTERSTPRQWMNFLVNDNFGSVVANDGSGFIFCSMPKFNITKHYSLTDYLIRTLNGKRTLLLESSVSGRIYSFFEDSEGFTYTAGCGYARFYGTVEGAAFTVTFFVPQQDSCECWLIQSKGAPGQSFHLTVGQEYTLSAPGSEDITLTSGAVFAKTEVSLEALRQEAIGVFAMQDAVAHASLYQEQNGKYHFAHVTLEKDILTGQDELVLSGAVLGADRRPLSSLLEKYKTPTTAIKELDGVNSMWAALRGQNTCEIPDARVQHFLNTWLKNQLHLTARYNRSDLMGYRDVMQDAWGYLLVDPAFSRKKLLEGLGKMYEDGRCPRQYDKDSDYLDARDFMDSPLWAGIALVDYVKETGDFAVLKEPVGYYGSEKRESVLQHILLSLDYLYHSRGKNGLVLMRGGDWLDGLEGINKYGEATTVWGTIAAFHVQNLVAGLLHRIGDEQGARLLEARSAEYKKIVNTVGWDGNWYCYAFIDDEPIGSSKCHEGKIFLNPQTWAVFSGIYDDEAKVEKMYRAIHVYLATMYGPLLNAPAYKKFGERCGRLQYQTPGTFANSAIYLHAASFKVFADFHTGNYDEGLDTLLRVLPGHADSCDGRRTSEPYCVGNVYYGPEHPCFGENLYTWFTATPAWLIHSGFEGLLGVKADFDGLLIKPARVSDWKGYTVTKVWRGTKYIIAFEKGDERGIWVDGQKINESLVKSDKEVCHVKVVY